MGRCPSAMGAPGAGWKECGCGDGPGSSNSDDCEARGSRHCFLWRPCAGGQTPPPLLKGVGSLCASHRPFTFSRKLPSQLYIPAPNLVKLDDPTCAHGCLCVNVCVGGGEVQVRSWQESAEHVCYAIRGRGDCTGASRASVLGARPRTCPGRLKP